MNTQRQPIATLLLAAALLALSACGTLQIGVEPTAAPPAPPAVQHIMLSPLDFGCRCDAIDRIAFEGIGAPVHVPDGALLTRITLFYRIRNALNNGVEVILQRQRGDQIETIVASVVAQRQDIGNHTDSIAVPPVAPAHIDMSQYAYRLILHDPSPFSAQDLPREIQQIQIEYILAVDIPALAPLALPPLNASDNALTPSPVLLGLPTPTPSATMMPSAPMTPSATMRPSDAAAAARFAQITAAAQAKTVQAAPIIPTYGNALTATALQDIIDLGATAAAWTPVPGGSLPYPPPPDTAIATATITPTPATEASPTFTFNSPSPTP